MKSANNILEPVIENIIILGFLMADTSSQQNLYKLCDICHIFTLYWVKITFTHFVLSHERHFQL